MERLQQLFNRIVGIRTADMLIENRWNPEHPRTLPRSIERPACWRRQTKRVSTSRRVWRLE